MIILADISFSFDINLMDFEKKQNESIINNFCKDESWDAEIYKLLRCIDKA